MGTDHDSGLAVIDLLAELSEQCQFGVGVEVGSGFVQKEEVGSSIERSGDGQALPLAAGEVPPVGERGAEPIDVGRW